MGSGHRLPVTCDGWVLAKIRYCLPVGCEGSVLLGFSKCLPVACDGGVLGIKSLHTENFS